MGCAHGLGCGVPSTRGGASAAGLGARAMGSCGRAWAAVRLLRRCPPSCCCCCCCTRPGGRWEGDCCRLPAPPATQGQLTHRPARPLCLPLHAGLWCGHARQLADQPLLWEDKHHRWGLRAWGFSWVHACLGLPAAGPIPTPAGPAPQVWVWCLGGLRGEGYAWQGQRGMLLLLLQIFSCL